MKQILSIAVLALVMSACQSKSAKNENANFPSTSTEATSSAVDKPTHNPAHGQPFHDCSIAVGAPLVAKEPATGSDGTKARLNPAHGQPGHRCDIAVGAPLT